MERMTAAGIEQPRITPPAKTGALVAHWPALWSHKWFVLAVVLVIGTAAWQGARFVMGTGVVVDQVKRGALIETVVASGHVETPFRVEIGSQVTGTVEQVQVDEGQRVTKGQPLVSLEFA